MKRRVNDAPAPGTPAWRKIITASKIPAMIRDGETGQYLGLGYKPAFDLYMEMMGMWDDLITPQQQAMFDDAHDAEDYAVNVWKRANPGFTQFSRGEVAFTDDELPFPNLVTIDRLATAGKRRHIIEVKRPRQPLDAPRDGWVAQVVFQMGVSGIYEADIVMVPVYGTPSIHPVVFDPELYAALVRDATHFWHLLEAETPPDSEDSKLAGTMYAQTPTTRDAIDLDESLMDQLVTVWQNLAALEKEAGVLENKVAEFAQTAKEATFQGITVASKRAGRFSEKRLSEDQRLEASAFEVQKTSLDTRRLKKEAPHLYNAGLGDSTFVFNRKAWS